MRNPKQTSSVDHTDPMTVSIKMESVRSSKISIFVSAALHAMIVSLAVVVIGQAAAAPTKVVTILLDGQPFFTATPCDSQEKAQTPPPKKATPEPASRDQKVAVSPEVLPAPEPPSVAEPVEESAIATHESVDVVVNAAPVESMPRALYEQGDDSDTRLAASVATGSNAANPGHDPAQSAYLKEHFNYIRELIMKHLDYPSAARRMGWKGQLTVAFVICEKGHVREIRIVESSGHKILDDNAVKTIRRIAPFPRPPVRAQIVIPIEYRFG
ncbi:MAG: energy transducer TonB [Smithellaceae bacterium]